MHVQANYCVSVVFRDYRKSKFFVAERYYEVQRKMFRFSTVSENNRCRNIDLIQNHQFYFFICIFLQIQLKMLLVYFVIMLPYFEHKSTQTMQSAINTNIDGWESQSFSTQWITVIKLITMIHQHSTIYTNLFFMGCDITGELCS